MPRPPPVRRYPSAMPPETDDDYIGTSCRDAATHRGFFLYPDSGISEGKTYVTSDATIEFINDDTKIRTIVDSEGILWGGGEVADRLNSYDVLPGKTLSLKTVRVNQERGGWIADGKGPDAPFHYLIVCPEKS